MRSAALAVIVWIQALPKFRMDGGEEGGNAGDAIQESVCRAHDFA
jgi:hypothetical protein